MATISSAGAAEGVDLTKVMSNVSLARLSTETPAQAPVEPTEDIADISLGGMRQSAITNLAETAARLTSNTLWSSTVASSDAPAAVTARSTPKAAAGSYKIEVAQIASAQVTSTATFSSLSTVVALGSLNIEKGSWDAALATFAPNPNWPKATVVLGPKNDTLDRVRDKINAAGLGVIATVVSDATGSRLVLRSTSTGADNGFKITTEEADASSSPPPEGQDVVALSNLGFDPASMGVSGMQLLQSASNAQTRIDDEPVESPLNAIESEAGLSLILKSPTDPPATISVEPDWSGMQQATQNFAQAYNALQSLGGSVANSVQRSARSLLGPPEQPTESGRALAHAGTTLSPTGTLQIDTQRLASALRQDPAAVRESQAMLAQQVLADLPTRPDTTPPDDGALPQSRTAPVDDSSSNAAGTLLRQRLLDQYQVIPSQAEMEDNDPSFLPPASRA